MANGNRTFTAPVFLASAFFVFGLAFVEKGLNIFHWSIPVVEVFPRQLLDWAVALLVFEIALTLRQLVELKIGERGAGQPLPDPERHPH